MNGSPSGQISKEEKKQVFKFANAATGLTAIVAMIVFFLEMLFPSWFENPAANGILTAGIMALLTYLGNFVRKFAMSTQKKTRRAA